MSNIRTFSFTNRKTERTHTHTQSTKWIQIVENYNDEHCLLHLFWSFLFILFHLLFFRFYWKFVGKTANTTNCVYLSHLFIDHFELEKISKRCIEPSSRKSYEIIYIWWVWCQYSVFLLLLLHLICCWFLLLEIILLEI